VKCKVSFIYSSFEAAFVYIHVIVLIVYVLWVGWGFVCELEGTRKFSKENKRSHLA